MIPAQVNGQKLGGVSELLKDSSPEALGAEPAWTCWTSMEKIPRAESPLATEEEQNRQGLWIDKGLNNKESRKLLKKISSTGGQELTSSLTWYLCIHNLPHLKCLPQCPAYGKFTNTYNDWCCHPVLHLLSPDAGLTVRLHFGVPQKCITGVIIRKIILIKVMMTVMMDRTVVCLMLSATSAMQLHKRKKEFLRFSLYLGNCARVVYPLVFLLYICIFLGDWRK